MRLWRLMYLSMALLGSSVLYGSGMSALNCSSADAKITFAGHTIYAGTMGEWAQWHIDGVPYLTLLSSWPSTSSDTKIVREEWDEDSLISVGYQEFTVPSTNPAVVSDTQVVDEEYVMKVKLIEVPSTLYDKKMAKDLWQGNLLCHRHSESRNEVIPLP